MNGKTNEQSTIGKQLPPRILVGNFVYRSLDNCRIMEPSLDKKKKKQ